MPLERRGDINRLRFSGQTLGARCLIEMTVELRSSTEDETLNRYGPSSRLPLT